MYVMAVSTISDNDKFWGSLKKAYGQLPKGAKWILAVASTDGTKAEARERGREGCLTVQIDRLRAP